MSIPSWIPLSLGAAPFQLHHHRTTYTAETTARREHVSGVQYGKVVVAIADGKPVLLVVPEWGRIDLGLACVTLGASEVRLADEDEMASLFPDSEVGAAPPLRHWPGVEIWMDPEVRHEGEFVFPAGTHQDALHMSFDDWFRVVAPKVGPLAHPTYIGA
jgi:Ala-tRNA(Pro) deacylase